MMWNEMKDERPEKEGMYLVFAPSADPKVPFKQCAWWSVSRSRWEYLPVAWALAITHWMSLPPDPELVKEP